MKGFGVPLDYNDLFHLVLSSQEEWKAAEHVAVYLNRHGTSKPIFSLEDKLHTFDLGRKVADASPDMIKIWEEEEQNAVARMENHWKEVWRTEKGVYSGSFLRCRCFISLNSSVRLRRLVNYALR